MVLSLLLAIILFVCFAMLIREGLWNNVLTAVNALFAGLLASSLWEPVATWLEGFVPSGTYLWDFISLWLIFCIAFLVLRTLTDLISRTRVRFKKPVDAAGGILFSLWVGWVLVSFTAMTLHTAPLAEHFLGFYEQPDQKIFLNMAAPDRQWLGFVQQLSKGSMDRGNPFDPQGQFINKYAKRRKEYEGVQGLLAE
jgi:uncharacterized membrane protein required for colicin V production